MRRLLLTTPSAATCRILLALGLWGLLFLVLTLGGCSMVSGLGEDMHWLAEMLKPAPR